MAPPVAAKRVRVLVLSGASLFDQGLVDLLRQSPYLEVMCHSRALDSARDCIRSVAPDVVLFCTPEITCSQGTSLLGILDACINAKVISLNLQNNTICVYQRETQVIEDVDDLLRVIRQGYGTSLR